jgi:thymidylate synthase (FAD) (EC 2.1.1.148)
MIHVELLSHTPDPEKVIATAAKLCYSSSDIGSLYDGLTPEKSAEFIDKLIGMGHASPVEHISFTFGIEGISRACSHQLVRHRIASYSQQSQRYVNMDKFAYVTPQSIQNDDYATQLYDSTMSLLTKRYKELHDVLVSNFTAQLVTDGMDEDKARSKAEKMANEDARYILPNACETKIVMTMNARSLFNFFSLRCCNRAQSEIRTVAEQMYRLVYKLAPTLFAHAGAPCVVTGRCPENSMSCGHMKDMQERYKRIRKECLTNDSNIQELQSVKPNDS